MHWTHLTLPLSDLDGAIRFFTEVCGLSFVRDRRKEGSRTVRLGPAPLPGQDPSFVLVAQKGVVREPSGHLVEFTDGQPLRGLG